MDMDKVELLRAITKIDNETDLDAIINAVKIARDRIGSKKKVELYEGDLVHLGLKEKDSYRLGSGKIIKMNPAKAKIKFMDGRTWTVPYNMLEKGEHPSVPWEEKEIKPLFGRVLLPRDEADDEEARLARREAKEEMDAYRREREAERKFERGS